ncbi:MAG: hypothetical protein ACR2RL_02670 [Gammaproteobacteria bacterium]
MTRFATLVALCISISLPAGRALAALEMVDFVSASHLAENAEQVVQTLARLGRPLDPTDVARLREAAQQPEREAAGTIQQILDPYCLVGIRIDEEAWLRVRPASTDPNARRLRQHRWRPFLVKVHNEAAVTTPLAVSSPHALAPEQLGADTRVQDPDAWYRWAGLNMVLDPPMPARLSGERLDYRVMQMYSREAGVRAADLVFNLGGGQVARGHFADVSLLFYVEEAKASRDHAGQAPEKTPNKIMESLTTSGLYRVRIQTRPDPIPFQALFELDVKIRDARDPKRPLPGITLERVDAIMPAHGHGMTTQPEISMIADGTFRVRGMMFHMRGEGAHGQWVIRTVLREGTADVAEFEVPCCPK